jgi:uncharacterized protein YhfF
LIDKELIKAYWQSYLDSQGLSSNSADTDFEAWSFGNTPEMADRLGELVRQGIKTATSSLVWTYDAEDSPYPKLNDTSIILDGRGDPLCIIETIEVEIRPYLEVDELHAYEEGEGDRTLAYWRKVHWQFFSEECESIGKEPSEEMLVACEKFKLLYV